MSPVTASSSEALFPWVCTASYSVFSWEPRLEVDGPAKDMLANCLDYRAPVIASAHLACVYGNDLFPLSLTILAFFGVLAM